MTTDQLIREGRRLQKPSSFLRPVPQGDLAAVWYGTKRGNSDRSCWLTIDAACIPLVSPILTDYLSILTDEGDCVGGRIVRSDKLPPHPGVELYAYAAQVLPPVNALFAYGSESVGDWLRVNGWERGWAYNDNFGDSNLVRGYEAAWMTEHPLFLESDVYAVLGGWHFPWPDDDWQPLVGDQLLVTTRKDSEPWVETWLTRDENFKVIQRVT